MLCKQTLKIFKSEYPIGTHNGSHIIDQRFVPLSLFVDIAVIGSKKFLTFSQIIPESVEVLKKL